MDYTICCIFEELFPMIASFTRPLGPVFGCIEDRERASRGMEELGSCVCRESYPTFWFFSSSHGWPDYYSMVVSRSSQKIYIRFCVYLLSIDRIPETSEPTFDTHELMFLSWYVYDISPEEFSKISIKHLTSRAVVYKIFRNVLAEKGFHRLFKDWFPSLEMPTTEKYHKNESDICYDKIEPKKSCFWIRTIYSKECEYLIDPSHKCCKYSLCPGLQVSLFEDGEKGNKIDY